jgi:heptaprenyl diphosphate synthase
MGAMTSGASEAVAASISAYGEKFGVAFQLSDDLLDIASESEASGKTPGTDLREGIRTLPVLLALRSTDPAGARLRELLAAPLVDDDLHAEALTLLRASPAMAEAREELVRWTESARAELVDLPAGAAREALSQMCDVVVDRSV